MVIPGFMATDPLTRPLRQGMGEAGWRTHGWGLGFNRGARAGLIEEIGERIDAVRDGRPILLVGWSLGGLFARETARSFPDKVSHVVTLGSPFGGSDRRANNAWRLYEAVAGHSVDAPPIEHFADKPPVPTLAIWSRRDGIVAERAASGIAGECDRSVEVDAAHMAMATQRRAVDRIIPIIENFVRAADH
jgi:pimeloyl-ACP methyl ester carboxylesterase